MLAGIPLSLALGFDPGRVEQQVERSRSATVRDSDVQCLLAAAQCAEVRHFSVKACQPQQTFDEPGRLSKGHTEQHLHRETDLDRSVAERGVPPALAVRCCVPGNLGIKPDR